MTRTIRAVLAGTAAAALWSCSATVSAQTDDGLVTAIGHDLSVSVGSYTYAEPNTLPISIQGTKVSGEYTGTASLNQRQHWFAQANVRGTLGNVIYTGWCSPWMIVRNSASPNGYALDLGDASPCGETGDSDWYLEGRAMVGKDLIGHAWGLSPYGGVGFRHLSNGTAGVSGYRTDNYLYLPFGATVRTDVASHVLSFTMEYDRLLHGWQKTRGSELGGGDVPATTTAPAFTIDGMSDVAFAQDRGEALRASAKYQVNPRWSVEPYYIRWSVRASPVNDETVAFTVNNVTAREQLGFYEPSNVTNEFGIKFGLHFK